jgi:hypothetical protein
MKFTGSVQVAGLCTSLLVCAALATATVPLLILRVSSRYLVFLIAYYASSIIWNSIVHKWLVYGTVGLAGKGCTRMRPKLPVHLSVIVWNLLHLHFT